MKDNIKVVYISAFNGVILAKTRLTVPRFLYFRISSVRLESADVRIRNRYCFMLVRPSIPRLGKTTRNTRGQKSSKQKEEKIVKNKKYRKKCILFFFSLSLGGAVVTHLSNTQLCERAKMNAEKLADERGLAKLQKSCYRCDVT